LIIPEAVLFSNDKSVTMMFLRDRGVFPNSRCMDNLFFKPHELAARDRKEKDYPFRSIQGFRSNFKPPNE
jgi:hypothetical protein